ncbi:hypothetical protein [Kibdelosporangium phytohabitans]|uniref:Uncharacterized protein n=1 Tax=Kibdelosporangium phytohabitans TaxID=860235 RepID=A0A0N9I1X6_9PSEU|nr:hypothetical protein [Kibdelosporangium phytohabitans]ALG08420.1 hypothetical protein AOZ06_17205 [Kibdelosporangium phytohabitans]MBE1470531.1 hypothetical protein [Kibdelosporangium phytohabitans]
MSIKLDTRAPRTRCHRCGDAEIAVICHHCGRPMCDDHRPEVADAISRPFTSEFEGLGLQQNSSPYHCSDCDHVVKPSVRKFAYIAAGALAVGLLLAFLTTAAGIIVMLLALAGGAAAVYEDRRRTAEMIRTRPPLPVVPNIDAVSVRETVRGDLVLDEAGTYRTSVTPVEGRIAMNLTFGRPDQDRLRAYRTRFRLTEQDPVRFSAGYAVLSGRAGLQFTEPGRSGNVLPLEGNVLEHPFLTSSDTRGDAKWRVTLPYRLASAPRIDAFPLWLTPSLLPESARRALEIEVQWLGEWPSAEMSLEMDRIEQLTLFVPVGWGNVEGVSRRATIGGAIDPEGGGRRIEWKQLSPESGTGQRLVLSMRFDDEISLTDTITGSIEATFKGSLSGLEGVDMYHPMGRRRPGEHSIVRTRVTANISLSLNGVRYQDVRVVPDHTKASDTERPEIHGFPGVIPDHTTIVELTNAMSDAGYYVKRVIENPPRGGGKANVVNRAWDIAGRRYDGVYPVNFHITVTGEEVHGGDIVAEAGNTKVRLNVNGTYASDQMEQTIENEWDRLRSITVQTLGRLERHQAVHEDEPEVFTHGAPRHAAPDQSTGELRAKLLRRRDAALDALLDKEISKAEYQEMVTRIDRQLSELDGE